jgi:hypothetical protein
MNQQIANRNTEIENIQNEARQDAGFQSMLKFKKGRYFCEGEEVSMDAEYLAHCRAWAKTWVHFEDNKVVERKIYRVANGEHAPERDQLPDNDESAWPIGLNDKPQDPWVLQYLLPLENPETGDVHIFVAQSFGGRRAVGELCTKWAKRAARSGSGQPLVKLAVAQMPTKKWGDVPRPDFVIIGWDDGATTDIVKEVKAGDIKEEFNDEIPF